CIRYWGCGTGDARIPAAIARGVPSPYPVAVAGARTQTRIAVAVRGDRGQRCETAAAHPLAAFDFVTRNPPIICRRTPAQIDPAAADGARGEIARYRRRSCV